MLEVRQVRWAAWALAAIVLVVAGGRLVASWRGEGEVVAPVEVLGAGAAAREASPGADAGDDGSGAGGAHVHVHVAGAVRRPGLYRVPQGARIAEAIERAGGAARRAALDGVNLAALVVDGAQVLVPRRGAVAAPAPAGAAGAPATGPSPAGVGAPATGRLDLNTATAEQLDALQGVGPATAQAILEYRGRQGRFRSVDELDAVPGIGPARLATLREAVGV